MCTGQQYQQQTYVKHFLIYERRCLYISNQSTQYILPQQNYKYLFLSKKQIKSFLVVLNTMAMATTLMHLSYY